MSAHEAETLFGDMLDGKMSDEEIATTLIAIADRGETADEIVGAARAMQARMIPVKAPQNAIDVCGTGGDGQHSLNVSTAVAIVVAACGVPVAKHGNRAASSKAGGADTLEALGLNLDRASETAEATLADLGIAFLFAQKHHPALARIAPIRKSLGRRTIFNLLGPLCNPARVTAQLIGVPTTELADLFGDIYRDIGLERISAVSGADGFDEVSISDKTWVNQGFHGQWFAPEDAGLRRHPTDAIRGGDAKHNAAELYKILTGADDQNLAYRDAVLLNAAFALVVAEHADDVRTNAEEAAEALDRGLAKALLDCWVAF